MSKFFYTFFMMTLWGSLMFSLQGCDQIQKFVDYLSPSRKPVQETAQPAPKTAEPAAPEALQQPQPVAPAAVKTEEVKNIAPNVLAQVGSWSITIEEFNNQLKGIEGAEIEELQGFDINNIEHKQFLLQQLIQQQVLVYAAQKEKMDQDPGVVEAMKAFRDTLLAQSFAEKITANMTVSDKEVEDFYNQNQELLAAGTQWHVKEIVVDTEDKARAILVELNQGASFEEVAKAKSIGKTAAQGGDLGTVIDFSDNERMGQIVSTLDVGAVSGLFRGPEGFYIVKLVDKKEGAPVALDDIREDLKNYVLMMKQQQALMDVVERVEAEKELYINAQLLEE